MVKQRRNGRVRKDEWLATALDELERGGIEAVRVERLAKLLAISKSGFYWHFKDRKDLHQHLLDYWIHEFTEVVTSNPLLIRGKPIERLEKVSALIEENDLGKYDLAVRAWAQYDETAREAVGRVTESRLDFLRNIFREIGFVGEELEMRSTLFVAYHTWESATFARQSSRKRTRMRRRRLQLLTSQPT